MKRPAFLPSQGHITDEEREGGDDFGSIGDPKIGAASIPSELGTEENAEADSNSRMSLLSDQRGRQSAWGPARVMRAPRGPYGGGER